MKSLKAWTHSIIAAAIGGGATMISATVIDPRSFSLTHDGMISLAKIGLIGAMTGVAALLKQSPLPNPDCDPDTKK